MGCCCWLAVALMSPASIPGLRRFCKGVCAWLWAGRAAVVRGVDTTGALGVIV